MKLDINKLKKMTRDNDHGGALLYIATAYNYTKFMKIFTLINQIHEIEGHLPVDLYRYRYSASADMLAYIGQHHPADYEAIRGVL